MDLLRDDIDEILLKLNADDLIDVTKSLNMNIKDEKNKRTILRLIQKHIDSIEEEEHLSALKTGFQKDYGPKVQKATGNLNTDQSNVVENGRNGAENGRDGKGNGNASGKSLYDLLGATGVDDQRSAFHKDFKIKGFIGEVGQRDKLSYISLLKQIEEGKEKGYSDREIVNAVLRAITPGLYLRDVLETTEDLSLNRLMKFLQSHFVEKNTTDICQHLSSITQGS